MNPSCFSECELRVCIRNGSWVCHNCDVTSPTFFSKITLFLSTFSDLESWSAKNNIFNYFKFQRMLSYSMELYLRFLLYMPRVVFINYQDRYVLGKRRVVQQSEKITRGWYQFWSSVIIDYIFMSIQLPESHGLWVDSITECGNARTKCQYVHKMPIRSRLTDCHSILYSNSRTRWKYVAVLSSTH